MKILKYIFLITALMVAVSCDEVKEYPWNPEWDKYQPEQEPQDPEDPENQEPSDTPEEPEDPQEPEEPEKVGKARLVWIDAAANFKDYANDKEQIASDMKKIKDTGFTGVIVDVRPTNSGLLFKSSVEPALTRVDAWSNGYRWLERTEDFDYLQAFIDAGKENGLDVYASMNTMVGGCLCPYGLGEDGVLYNDPSKKDWASVINTADGLVNCLDLEDTGAKFFNPANDEVVNYLISILEELAAYDITDAVMTITDLEVISLKFPETSLKGISDVNSRTGRETCLSQVSTNLMAMVLNFRRNGWSSVRR